MGRTFYARFSRCQGILYRYKRYAIIHFTMRAITICIHTLMCLYICICVCTAGFSPRSQIRAPYDKRPSDDQGPMPRLQLLLPTL